MKPRRPFFLFLLSFLISAPVTATTFVVKSDGTGDFPTIQVAIDAALDGDIVELADGTFKGSGNRDLDFRGKAITVRSRGDDPQRCVIDCEGSEQVPHRGLYFHSGEGPEAVLRGVAITNGYAEEVGGAVCCENSSPAFDGCLFSSNTAFIGGGAALHNASPTFANCEFSGNVVGTPDQWASAGGGVWIYEANPTFTGCTFSGNSAADGGAVSCGSSSVIFVDCTFRENTSWYNFENDGGGALAAGASTLIFTSCTFEENDSGYNGGAVLMYSCSGCSFNDCRFVENTARGNGGAILWGDCSPNFSDCEFTRNVAFWNGGAISSHSDAAVFEGCTFWENTAGNWGGAVIDSYESSPHFSHCTFARNWAESGGGVFCHDAASPTFVFCVIAFSGRGEAIACGDYGCDPNLIGCDLFGNEGGDWTGCLESQHGVSFWVDPLFCDLHAGNLRLCSNSPCLPENNVPGALIGAHGEGCGDCETPVGTVTWGQIKAGYAGRDTQRENP